MVPKKRILVPLAEGFEEIEAITIVDVLRRAGLDVTTAGLKSGAVTGAHDLELTPDAELAKLAPEDFDMIVLPGGMPGATNLMEDANVLKAVRALHAKGRHVAAICAAPIVLAKAGVISGTPVTCYPGFESRLGDAKVQDGARVVKSGKVITSRGPGTALEFALALVEELLGPAKSKELAKGMLAAV